MTDHTTNETTNEIEPGYCHCGCGQKTSIATHTDKRTGAIKGKPQRFVAGHGAYRKNHAPPNPSGLCMCGCGQSTPIAKMTNSKLGHLAGHPIRYIVGHTTRRPIEERFWEKVDKRGPNECWIWTGTVTNGRAIFSGGDRANRRQGNASRFSWELTNGPVPEGLSVCHNCPDGDNPLCVNPAHLWLGTQSDNMRDMASKGRHSTPAAKLTPEQVREIRRLSDAGAMNKTLAAQFGIRPETVSEIIHRKKWKHV